MSMNRPSKKKTDFKKYLQVTNKTLIDYNHRIAFIEGTIFSIVDLLEQRGVLTEKEVNDNRDLNTKNYLFKKTLTAIKTTPNLKTNQVYFLILNAFHQLRLEFEQLKPEIIDLSKDEWSFGIENFSDKVYTVYQFAKTLRQEVESNLCVFKDGCGEFNYQQRCLDCEDFKNKISEFKLSLLQSGINMEKLEILDLFKIQ